MDKEVSTEISRDEAILLNHLSETAASWRRAGCSLTATDNANN